MTTIEEMGKLINSEIKLLKTADNKTNEMLPRKNKREMARKKRLSITKLKEIQETKTNVIKQKLLEGNIDAKEWGTQIGTRLMKMKLIMLDDLNNLYT